MMILSTMAWSEVFASMSGWLLTYLIHSTILICGVWLATRHLRGLKNPTRNTLWKLAMVGGIVTASFQQATDYRPPLGVLGFEAGQKLAQSSVTDVSPATVATVAAAGQAVEQAPVVARHEIASESGVVSVDVISPAQEVVAPVAAPVVAAATPVVPQTPLWPGVLACLWILGGAAALALQGLGIRRFYHQLKKRTEVLDDAVLEGFVTLCQRAGISRKIRLTVSENICSPVALGRSEVVLPQQALDKLTPEQVTAVLAHELAHLERRDWLWAGLATAIESVLFFQPLNALARRGIQDSAEYLCDDWSAHYVGTGEPLAKSLAEVAVWSEASPHPQMLPGMVDRRSPLVDRISRLIDGKHDRLDIHPSPWRVGAILGPMALLALVAPRVAGASSEIVEPVVAEAPEAPAPEVPDVVAPEVVASDDGKAVVVTLADGTKLRVQVPEAKAPPAPPPVVAIPEPPAPPVPPQIHIPEPPPVPHFDYHYAPPEMDFDEGDLWGAIIIGGVGLLLLDSMLDDFDEPEYDSHYRVEIPQVRAHRTPISHRHGLKDPFGGRAPAPRGQPAPARDLKDPFRNSL